MTTFVTADQHWGHERIIGLCNRPFGSLVEMHDVMASCWCDTVAENDTVYVIGDWAWNRDEGRQWEHDLPGRKVFLAGSHDWNRRQLPLALRITKDKRTFYLCHWPWASWQRRTIMVHGHWHREDYELSRPERFNACVDLCGFRPVALEQVVREVVG